MSGSIGGNRIPKSAVQTTVDKYIEKVLSGFPGFKSAKITGSYNAQNSNKKDFGDIDLTTYIEAKDKTLKQVKKDLANYLEASDYTVPFRAGRNKGKKAQMYGTVVTCQVPIEGFDGLLAQVDNMVVLSEKDQEYQKNFLDADAAKQALEMGLVRVILQEEDPRKVFERMGIKKLPELDKNQEFEFVLSPAGLSLRKVTLDNFKETDHEEIWRSNDWNDVVKLLQNYDLTQEFDYLLAEVKEKVQNIRSKRRIIGIMKAMINVGVGEKGTQKGDAKLRAIKAAEETLGTLKEVEEISDKKGNTIGLYGGGFKPPHKGHYSIVQKLLEKAGRVIIFIGNGTRSGIPISQDQSEKIWNIYVKASGWSDRVEVRKANSPVGAIYALLKDPELQEYQYIIPKTQDLEGEDKKWSYLEKNPEKFPNVKLMTLPKVIDKESDKLSASTLRASADRIKKGDWIPSVLTSSDASDVIDIALQEINVENIRESMKKAVGKALDTIEEGMSGTAIAPTSVVASKYKEKLSQFYEYLMQNYDDQFNIQFNGSHILVKPKYPGDMENFDYQSFAQNQDRDEDRYQLSENANKEEDFDYAKNIASLIEFFEKEGVKVHPLPEIILNKEKQTKDLMAKTGDYQPGGDGLIRVYADGRQPRDVLRSLSHELVHKSQDLQGKFKGKDLKTNVKDSKVLEELEAEAYLKGNLLFRKWLESKGCY